MEYHCYFPLLQIIYHTPGVAVYVGITVLVILLFTSAFISGTEAAFFSLTPDDLHMMQREREHVPAYRKAIRMLNHQDRLLATILISNNLVNVGIVILATFVTNEIATFDGAPIAGFLIQVVLITFLLLLFGEILPKLLAANSPRAYVQGTSRPLYVIYQLLRPFSLGLAFSATQVHRRFSPKVELSMDELGQALEIAKSQLPDEEGILKRIVNYGQIEAYEIMRPRMDMVAVECNVSFDELKRIVIKSGYSRIPIFDDTLDNITGVLYVKDLMPHIHKGEQFRWTSLIRKAYFVPEKKKIDDLFGDFQRDRIHMAIVVDEYGGTCGIVSLEDILEEIFGEIADESDGKEQLYTKVSERVYLCKAKMQLNDFCKVLQLEDGLFDDIRGEAETLAGLLLEQLGRFPKRGETLKLHGLGFTVEAVSNRRIESIKVEV